MLHSDPLYSVLNDFDVKPSQKEKKIFIHSLDFDGCVFNEAYKELTSQDPSLVAEDKTPPVVKANNHLLDFILEPIQEVEKTASAELVVMVGSHRQCKSVDDEASKRIKTQSAFSSLIEINDALLLRLKKKSLTSLSRIDPTLLADYTSKIPIPEGENFRKIVAKDKDFTYTDSELDRDKLNILYSQFSRLAVLNPKTDIEYNFYDDYIHVLRKLSVFFQLNPEVIPAHVKINLYHYNGKSPVLIGAIQGIGPIDPLYKEKITFFKLEYLYYFFTQFDKESDDPQDLIKYASIHPFEDRRFESRADRDSLKYLNLFINLKFDQRYFERNYLPYAPFNSMTILMLCLKKGCFNQAKFLLKHAPDLSIRTPLGHSAYDIARSLQETTDSFLIKWGLSDIIPQIEAEQRKQDEAKSTDKVSGRLGLFHFPSATVSSSAASRRIDSPTPTL